VASDIHLSLSYMTSGEVKRIGESLRSDPSDTSPGWYLRAYRNEGYEDIAKYTRIFACDIEGFAKAAETALARADQVPAGIAVAQALRNQTIEHKRQLEERQARLERTIEEAQDGLRRLAEERAAYGA
jgi:hypothetical protein